MTHPPPTGLPPPLLTPGSGPLLPPPESSSLQAALGVEHAPPLAPTALGSPRTWPAWVEVPCSDLQDGPTAGQSTRFPGRRMVALDQSHAHQVTPDDIEAPPFSVYVPYTVIVLSLSLLPADTTGGTRSWPPLGEAGSGNRVLAPPLPRGGHLGNGSALQRGPALPTVSAPLAGSLAP